MTKILPESNRIKAIGGMIAKAPVHFYRGAISPMLPPSCRYTPTCSQYALQAIDRFGPIKGVVLASKRILRCHPWGGSGYDPVPPANKSTDNE